MCSAIHVTGAGACGMYKANTISSVIKAMGMSLPYRGKNNLIPATTSPS